MPALYVCAFDTNDDRDMFERIYIENRQKMYSIAFAILRSREDAEDAVHQSFIQIAKHFKKIKSLSCQEIVPYIVIIVRNTSLNMYSKNKKCSQYLSFDDDSSEIVETAYVDDSFFEDIDYMLLVDAIKQLPSKYKDVIYLHYVCGFSTKEVALSLGASVSSVWKIEERARKMLKEILERNG